MLAPKDTLAHGLLHGFTQMQYVPKAHGLAQESVILPNFKFACNIWTLGIGDLIFSVTIGINVTPSCQ